MVLAISPALSVPPEVLLPGYAHGVELEPRPFSSRPFCSRPRVPFHSPHSNRVIWKGRSVKIANLTFLTSFLTVQNHNYTHNLQESVYQTVVLTLKKLRNGAKIC